MQEPLRYAWQKKDSALTVTDLNDFNGPAQTTNLGGKSSNLFGRAIPEQNCESQERGGILDC
jgi:hypothetical protein